MPKSILVTGCSSPRGIGFALARILAGRGHRVIATVRDHSHDAGLRDGLDSQLTVVDLDLLDPGSIAAALDQTGGIDVLVNNAGYGLIGGIEQSTLEQARAQFETNYFGTLGLVRQVVPQLRERGGGHILAVSTIFSPTLCPLGLGHYIASKAALEKALEALAGEVAPWNIRVTNVQPGPVATELSRDWARPQTDPRPTLVDELYEWVGQQPGLAMETPEEVAQSIAALIEQPEPPLAAQTSAPATAWVATALRDPSRESERATAGAAQPSRS